MSDNIGMCAHLSFAATVQRTALLGFGGPAFGTTELRVGCALISYGNKAWMGVAAFALVSMVFGWGLVNGSCEACRLFRLGAWSGRLDFLELSLLVLLLNGGIRGL